MHIKWIPSVERGPDFIAALPLALEKRGGPEATITNVILVTSARRFELQIVRVLQLRHRCTHGERSTTVARRPNVRTASLLGEINRDSSTSDLADGSVSSSSNAKSLSCLELSETSVTDAGLSALTSLKKLKFLGLKKTRITNAGLSSLVRIPSLRKLILDDTLITDEGLSTLLKMNNPSYLHLRGCKGVSNQGLLKLKAAFPNCEINSTAYAGNSTSADGNIPYDVNSHSTDANARDRGGNSGKSDNDSSSNEKDGGSTGGSFGTSDSTG